MDTKSKSKSFSLIDEGISLFIQYWRVNNFRLQRIHKVDYVINQNIVYLWVSGTFAKVDVSFLRNLVKVVKGCETGVKQVWNGVKKKWYERKGMVRDCRRGCEMVWNGEKVWNGMRWYERGKE